MAQTVLITITAAGSDTGPFDLYTNADGYVTPFANNIAKATLEAGYTSIVVPDGATIIRVQSDNFICENFIDLSIITTTTTTSSTSTSTTSTTSTTTSTSSTTTTTTTIPMGLIEVENVGATFGTIVAVYVNSIPVTYISGTAFPLTFGASGLFETTELGIQTVTVEYTNSSINLSISVIGSDSVEVCQGTTLSETPLNFLSTVIDTVTPVNVIYNGGLC